MELQGDKGRGTRGEAHEGGGEWKQTTHTHTHIQGEGGGGGGHQTENTEGGSTETRRKRHM